MPVLFQSDRWLSDVIGLASFRMCVAPATAGGPAAIRAGMAAAAPRARAFYFAKIGGAEVAGVEALVRAGFNVTDVSVTFAHTAGDTGANGTANVEEATAADAGEVAELAGRCFTFSRFHADRRVELEQANAVKREWARNSCLGRAANVYIVRVAGRIAGFLAVLKREGQAGTEAVIDLIGVETEHQGKGLGRLLTQRFIRDWSGRARQLCVGTQMANIPALRLYESLGFRISETSYVLHAHTLDGEVMA